MKGVNHLTRRDFLKLSGAGAAGVGLLGVYGCGGGASANEIEWTTWGNPGELERFVQFTDEFNKEHKDIQAELKPIPNVEEYNSKMLTQLNGGTAPDLFYSFENNIGTWVDKGVISELTDRLKGPKSQSPPDEVISGLWGGAQTEPGTYFGIPVDCNPYTFWFNKKVLQDAGINDNPVDLYERGEWKWDTFQGMLEQLRGSGVNGFVLGQVGLETFSWATSNGGKIVEGDRFVLHEDPKSVEAHVWLYDNIRNKNITYTTTLPSGQGPDALFMSNRVGFVPAGRWYLPIFKQNPNLEFDIVPWPTNTDSKDEPVGIPTAFMVMNKDSEDPDKAFQFLTEFVSREGQIFRLKGGGNAVPSVTGADEVVLEGNPTLPEHAQFFLDVRDIGYAYPGILSRVPDLNQDLIDIIEPVFVSGGNIRQALAQAGEQANKKIQEQTG